MTRLSWQRADMPGICKKSLMWKAQAFNVSDWSKCLPHLYVKVSTIKAKIYVVYIDL